jgi:hypothetical protein
MQQVRIKACEAKTSSGGIGLQFTKEEVSVCCGKLGRSPPVDEWVHKVSQRKHLVHCARNTNGGMDG